LTVAAEMYNLYQPTDNVSILEQYLVTLFTTMCSRHGISVILEVFNDFIILVQWTCHMCIEAVFSSGIKITLYL